MTSRGLEVLDWAHAYLPSPSSPSQPLVLSDEQAEFVVELYSIDAKGVYVYRRAACEQAKGWGKSPLGAVLALAEFCGPFAPPIPLVQLAACSEEQAYSNTYSVVLQLLSENDGKAADELGVEVGKGRMLLRGNPGAKLEAVSSSFGAREGQRLTFGVLDETQHWLKSNGGIKLAATLRRNAAKMNGRTLELANAPEVGEGSVAEATEADDAKGHKGILFYAARPSAVPDPEMDDNQLVDLLREVYSGAPWVDVNRILLDVRDPATPWGEALRFYFNVPSSGVLAAVEAVVWDARERKRALEDGEPLALGFDGSHSRDGTALVGATRDGMLFPIVILERPDGAGDEWRIDRTQIHRALDYMFSKYDVQFVYCDPWTWQAEVTAWAEKWPDRIVEFSTNSVRRMAPAVDRFRHALIEGQATHDGDPTLRRHVLAARLKPHGRDEDGRGIYLLEKPAGSRRIDAAVASVLAYEASAQLTDPPVDPEPMVAWG